MVRWFGAAALVLVLGGCGDDGPRRIAVNETPPGLPGPGEESAGGPPPVGVRAVDNTFEVAEVVVAAGTEVRWRNAGRNDHDIVPVDGDSWGVAEARFAPGDEYAHVFEEPGEYEYYCSLHGTPTAGMVGTVTVLEAP